MCPQLHQKFMKHRFLCSNHQVSPIQYSKAIIPTPDTHPLLFIAQPPKPLPITRYFLHPANFHS